MTFYVFFIKKSNYKFKTNKNVQERRCCKNVYHVRHITAGNDKSNKVFILRIFYVWCSQVTRPLIFEKLYIGCFISLNINYISQKKAMESVHVRNGRYKSFRADRQEKTDVIWRVLRILLCSLINKKKLLIFFAFSVCLSKLFL